MECAGTKPLITQLEKEAEEFQAIVRNQMKKRKKTEVRIKGLKRDQKIFKWLN